MKKCTLTTAPFNAFLASGCLIVAATSLQAADVSSGFYLGADAGLNMMTGVRTAGGGDIRLDPGMRLGLEGGYGFKLADHLTLGVEGESGVLWNGLSAIKSGGGESESGGNLYQIPLLANLVLNYHFNKWTPYVGFGGGLDYISANAWSSHNAPILAAGDDFGPAMQLEAGVRYQLSDRSEVGLGYKYLTAFSQKLEGDIQGRLSEVNNHALSLTYTYHF